MKKVWWFVAWSCLTYLFCLAAMAAGGCPLRAAPAPLPRRPAAVAPRVEGAYRLLWGAGEWRALVIEGGHWRCERLGQVWVGEWHYNPAGPALEVIEWPVEQTKESHGGITWQCQPFSSKGGKGEWLGVVIELSREAD